MRRLAYMGPILVLLLLALVLNPLPGKAISDPQPHAQTQTTLHFYDQLCRGEWYGGFEGAPFPEWPKRLPCPGEAGDSDGFVQKLTKDDTLENGRDGSRTFETYPTMQKNGFIRGTFSLAGLGVTLQNGDHFIAQVGFVEGMTSARVRFMVIYDPDPIESGDERQLADITKSYDGRLRSIDIDLSRYAGQRGNVILRVETDGPYTQDRAVWVNARIERPQPPSPTSPPTSTPTRTPTTTSTPPPEATTPVPTTITPTPTTTETTVVSEGCEGTALTLLAEPLRPEPNQLARFTAAAAPGCNLVELHLWVNDEHLTTCAGSKCTGEGGPYPDGIHLFEAIGFDDLGNPVYPGNMIIEGESLSASFDHIGDPIETCPLCPELPGLGPCIEQICTGPNAPNFYEHTEVDLSCRYENVVELEYQFQAPSIEHLFGGDSTGPYEDRCANTTDLIEFYCQGTGTVREIHYACPFACSDGACLPCLDTDGGYRIWEYGEMVNDPQGRVDVCLSSTQLQEYYCVGDEVKENTSNCDFCENGACQKCEDTDGGINPWEYGVVYDGTEDECLGPDWLDEVYNELTPAGCLTRHEYIFCTAGCNPSIRSCNATCSDGVQNGLETGVDCGGNCPASCMDCAFFPPGPVGGGDEAGRFSLSDPIVLTTAIDAMMEYADCLRDPACKSTLPWQASILYKGDYADITAADITNDVDAMMEAVGFYVAEHMGYVFDDQRPGWVPEIQSAAFTIQSSGARGCTPDDAVTPANAGQTADYCGDCEDHAILRAALLRRLGIPRTCVFNADYYEGYWGGGHTFNLVHYRGKWRIMDYHVLGWYFTNRWTPHHTENVWNDYYGVYWCPDWKDNLGDGNYDAGCNKTSPASYTRNYYNGDICPPPMEIEFMGVPILITYSWETYYSDTCP